MGMPVVAAAAALAKTEVVSKVVSGFKNAISGLFGDTATDRQRKAEAAAALERALNGDASGVAYLLGRAGIVIDSNVKVAPDSIKHLYRTALRTYYGATAQTPSPLVAKALGLTQSPAAVPTGSAFTFPAPVGTTAGVPVPLTDPFGQTPTTNLPSWLIPALAVGGIAFFLSSKRSRR
jgi:hypothetical protein